MTWYIVTFAVGCLVGLVAGIVGAVVYPKRKDTLFREYLKREYGVKESHRK